MVPLQSYCRYLFHYSYSLLSVCGRLSSLSLSLSLPFSLALFLSPSLSLPPSLSLSLSLSSFLSPSPSPYPSLVSSLYLSSPSLSLSLLSSLPLPLFSLLPLSLPLSLSLSVIWPIHAVLCCRHYPPLLSVCHQCLSVAAPFNQPQRGAVRPRGRRAHARAELATPTNSVRVLPAVPGVSGLPAVSRKEAH